MGAILYRIAIAQINPTVGDLRGNFEKVTEYIETARKSRADLVIFPELAICGYPPEDLLFKDYFIKDNIKTLESVAEKVCDITAVVGFVDMHKNDVYNAAAIINNGKIKSRYYKNILPNYGVFDEKRYFKAGNQELLFTDKGVNFGITICEDIWQKTGPHTLLSSAGADVVINISASPYYVGRLKARKDMLIKRAKETGAFICYANLIGGQDELVFDGASLIFDPKGDLIAAGKQFEEDLIMADIDIRDIMKKKRQDIYDKNISKIVINDEITYIEKPMVNRPIQKPLDKLEEIYAALVLGTKDYVRKNGFEKVAIGLSGGIDSSLTALIACDALGRENVTGVSMPSRYSSQETQRDAKTLANNLQINFLTIPIDSIYDVYLVALSDLFAGLQRNITEENIQARIRANILMALSNKFGWLVLTTGNKSEISVGYCTLYGDMAGGFALIKDVFKTLVYKLAEFRNRKEARGLIPAAVFRMPPTAELKYDQKDEDTLPPYSVLDPILKDYIEEDMSFEEIIAGGKEADIVRKVLDMVDKSEYKRRQAVPGVKITPKAFGKDRRLPITNRYKNF